MAELFRPVEGDESPDDDGEKSSERPKKPLKKWMPPIVQPPMERPATAEEVKKSVEFIPPPLINPLELQPKAEQTEDDDEEADKEEAKEFEPAESVEATDETAPWADEQLAELTEAVTPDAETAAASPDEKFDLSEELIHLREPRATEHASSEAVSEVQAKAEEPAELPTPPAQAAAGGAPPRPPVPPTEFGSPERPEEPQSPVYYGPAEYTRPEPLHHEIPGSHPGVTPEQLNSEIKDVKAETEEARKRNMRLLIVAGVTTAILLKSYLDTKARQLDGVKLGLDFVQDQLSSVFRQTEQVAQKQAAHEAAPPPAHSPEKPAPASPAELQPVAEAAPEERQLFDMEGNQIILQPGQHVERSAGGYSVVLDEHNRVVHDAIHYGEAFKRDQKREQLDDDVFAALAAAQGTASPPADQGTSAAPAPLGHQPTSQQPIGLPHQSVPVDLDHRLSEPQDSPILSAVTSPWLWLAIAILIIVYFIAALA